MTSAGGTSLEGLQMLRGIAALVVVLHHACSFVELPGIFNASILGGLFSAGHLGVDIFFVLSGFIIAYAHPGGTAPGKIGPYLLRRMLRIYPLYWIACLILFPFYFYLYAAEGEAVPWGQMTTDFFLLPSEYHPIIGVAWTLRFEVMFYALYSAFLLRKTVGWLLWFLLALMILLVMAAGVKLPPAASQLLSPYVLEFFAGVLACQAFTRMPLSRAGYGWLIATGISLISVIVAFELQLGRTYLMWNLMYGAASMPLVWGMAGFTWKRQGRFQPLWRLAALLGLYSYSIYLFHYTIIQQAFIHICMPLSGDGHSALVPWMITLSLSLAAVICGILIGKYVELPLLAWSKRQFVRH